MVNYKNGKVYKIICDNPDLVYYGSTVQKYLSSRLAHHRRELNCSSRKLFQYGNVKIILVEKVECESKDELFMRERFYIENNNCVNKYIPGQTKEELKIKIKEKGKEYRENNKEYQKEYYNKNKEKIKQYKKEYDKKNKEYYNKNKEKIKEYYQKNKEKINEKHKQKMTCMCGSVFRMCAKARHCRSIKHQTYMQNKNVII